MLHYSTVPKGLRIAHATLMYTKFVSFRIVYFFCFGVQLKALKHAPVLPCSSCVAISAYTDPYVETGVGVRVQRRSGITDA